MSGFHNQHPSAGLIFLVAWPGRRRAADRRQLHVVDADLDQPVTAFPRRQVHGERRRLAELDFLQFALAGLRVEDRDREEPAFRVPPERGRKDTVKIS